MKPNRTEFPGLAGALVLLSSLAFASSAYAHDGHRGGPGFDGPMFISERMADRLELDETQRQSIQNILEAAKPEFDALRERVRAEIETVLTDEQQAELEAMKQRTRDSFDRSRGKPRAKETE
jgi:Spy/CpxP family protein refolding chaperone